MSSTTGTYPGDDEDYITRILPQQLNRTSAAASQALAVHFSFYPQREGLENSTDLLDRCASHSPCLRHVRHLRPLSQSGTASAQAHFLHKPSIACAALVQSLSPPTTTL